MGAGGMAKSKTKSVVLRLMSQAGTGYYYTFRTTMKGVREKLQLMKHDPVVNKHVLFKEERIKK